jgi:16S rRNA (guanine527-N7)-methyltransferase
VLATPGLTALKDPAEARRVLLDDALAGLELVRASPARSWTSAAAAARRGSRLAVSLPEREVTLLEAERRKTEFLERGRETAEPAGRLGPRREPSNRLLQGRRREGARTSAGCGGVVPAARRGRRAVSCSGSAPRPDASAVARVAGKIAGELEESPPGFLVIRKTGPTPPGFPRRPGVAKKRPLA